MLSKLDHVESSTTIQESSEERQALHDAIERYFRAAGGAVSTTPASGGTLGVCYHLAVDGKRRFLKTHLPGHERRANLAKEGDVLRHLYGGEVVLEQMELR